MGVPQLIALANISGQLVYLGRCEEACEVARTLLDRAAGLPRPVNVYTRLGALNSLSIALVGLHRLAEAEQIAREAAAEAATSTEPAGNFHRTLLVNLAAALNAQSRHPEALDVLADAITITDPSAAHAGASAIAKGRATALLGLDRPTEAASAAQAGLTSALIAYDEPHARVRDLRALAARAGA